MHLCGVAVVGGPNSKEKPPSWSPLPIRSPLLSPIPLTLCPILPPFHALINNRRAVSDDEDDTVPTGQNDTAEQSVLSIVSNILGIPQTVNPNYRYYLRCHVIR